MIALRGTTVLPEMIVHFDVSREKSIRAVEAAMLHDQKVFLLTQKDPEVETPELDDLYRVGTIAYIKQVVKLPQDLYRVLVEGLDRAEILSLEQEERYRPGRGVSGTGERCHASQHPGTFPEILQRERKDKQRSGNTDHDH